MLEVPKRALRRLWKWQRRNKCSGKAEQESSVDGFLPYRQQAMVSHGTEASTPNRWAGKQMRKRPVVPTTPLWHTPPVFPRVARGRGALHQLFPKRNKVPGPLPSIPTAAARSSPVPFRFLKKGTAALFLPPRLPFTHLELHLSFLPHLALPSQPP